MIWILIILVIIVIITILKIKKARERKKVDEISRYNRGQVELAKSKSVNIPDKTVHEKKLGNGISQIRLNDRDEILAQRIKKLLFGISYWEFKNKKIAYENAYREMKQIGDKIETVGGWEQWLQIKNRVRILCGEHFMGFSKYLYIIEKSIRKNR